MTRLIVHFYQPYPGSRPPSTRCSTSRGPEVDRGPLKGLIKVWDALTHNIYLDTHPNAQTNRAGSVGNGSNKANGPQKKLFIMAAHNILDLGTPNFAKKVVGITRI